MSRPRTTDTRRTQQVEAESVWPHEALLYDLVVDAADDVGDAGYLGQVVVQHGHVQELQPAHDGQSLDQRLEHAADRGAEADVDDPSVEPRRGKVLYVNKYYSHSRHQEAWQV